MRDIYQQWFFAFPMLMACVLPLGVGMASIAAAWLLSYFIFGDVRKSFPALFRNPWYYIITGFFLLHVLALFYTANHGEGGFSIEIKLSFLAFPMVLFTHAFSREILLKILGSFVVGCVFSCLFNIARASYYYISEGINYFYYSDFTNHIHPSYYAMYLVMGILIVLWCYPAWFRNTWRARVALVTLIMFLSACVFITSSKLGIISWALLVPLTLIYIQLARRRYKLILILVFGFVASVAVAYKVFPKPFSRLEVMWKANSAEQIDIKSGESTVVRKLIWHESIAIIKENLWLGVGPGDANDVLYKVYEEKGMEGALRKHLNAHNQFLQTGIGLGLAGFILLLVMTVFTAILGVIRKNALLLLFSLLIILNFLVESMLQTQAGILFFVFFLCLLLTKEAATIHFINPVSKKDVS
ncbi:MAG: O-antigen ligase family protein [Bacteroidetes bacterium]|nr:O-antigen ligase family protein [Bacteroidota bacterium]